MIRTNAPGFAGMLCASVIAAIIGAVPARALPACAGPVEAANVRIMRVEKNGDLVLEDGRAVRLEGLRLPQGAKDNAPGFFADQAVAALRELAEGKFVTLAVFAPKEDRYGRLRAQVFAADAGKAQWLQIAMLDRGLARVAMSPERHECASELYAAEATARDMRIGVWLSSAYAVHRPDQLAGSYGTFQIVEGRVLSADVSNGRAYLDFGEDWRHDFKVTVSPDDLGHFRDAGVDPRGYQGLTVRVRGFVEKSGGPEIEVAAPESIEVVRQR